ncbi:MAG: hypothetical protein ACE5FT_00665 [Candidatus Nanoarchaeia archaeon]
MEWKRGIYGPHVYEAIADSNEIKSKPARIERLNNKLVRIHRDPLVKAIAEREKSIRFAEFGDPRFSIYHGLGILYDSDKEKPRFVMYSPFGPKDILVEDQTALIIWEAQEMDMDNPLPYKSSLCSIYEKSNVRVAELMNEGRVTTSAWVGHSLDEAVIKITGFPVR